MGSGKYKNEILTKYRINSYRTTLLSLLSASSWEARAQHTLSSPLHSHKYPLTFERNDKEIFWVSSSNEEYKVHLPKKTDKCVVNRGREMSWGHNISKLPFSSIPRISKATLHAKENVQKPISKRKLELLKEAGQSWKKEREDKPVHSTVFFKFTKHLHSPKRN